MPRHEPLESEMPHLDDNDVWFYQMNLERLIRISLPDDQSGRYRYMLRVLGAQARRANARDD